MEVEYFKQNTVSANEHETVLAKLSTKDSKIKQLNEELTKQRENLKRLQNDYDSHELGKQGLEKDLNEKSEIIKNFKEIESEIQSYKASIKELKGEIKDWKVENVKLSGELDKAYVRLEAKSDKLKEAQYQVQELRKVIEYLEDKNGELQTVIESLNVLENTIAEKDGIITKLKGSLKDTSDKLNLAESREAIQQMQINAHLDLQTRNMTFEPKLNYEREAQSELENGLCNLISTLRRFLETADQVEVNEIRSIVLNLIDEKLEEFGDYPVQNCKLLAFNKIYLF